jgi:hydrogenase maturation protease
MTILVGGVGEAFQRDLDVGRLAVERLQKSGWDGALVEELHYGAVAVAQRLAELAPNALILIGAMKRGHAAGSVRRRRVHPVSLSATEFQAAVGDAAVGYVGIDLVVEVASALGVLPGRTVSIEVEPQEVGPGEGLSSTCAEALEEAVTLVRCEVARVPMLELAGGLRARHRDDRLEPSAALAAMTGLLDELAVVDEEGRWGHTFSRRDELKLAVASGRTSEGMDHHDWALWWAMIEELDRLQAAEVRAGI